MIEGFQPLVGGHHLTHEEAVALRQAGFGGRVAGTLERTALLVVDPTYGFCGKPSHASLAAAVTEYPHACGPVAWEGIPRIRTLVEGARGHDVPIVFTRPTPPQDRPRWHGRLEEKNTRRASAPPDAFEIVPETGFTAGDTLLDKDGPSAFFGTPLVRWLHGFGVSGVVVCGVSTSGCVRATAVDAFSYDLRTTIVADASFDRIQASHEVALLDFELKYGDVRLTEDVVRSWGAAREVAAHPTTS